MDLYRLVMSNRLIRTSIVVLRTVSKQSMHVNGIISKTSSDRTFIIKTINALVKNGVVEKIRNPDHKEMRMIQPTSVGEESSGSFLHWRDIMNHTLL